LPPRRGRLSSFCDLSAAGHPSGFPRDSTAGGCVMPCGKDDILVS